MGNLVILDFTTCGATEITESSNIPYYFIFCISLLDFISSVRETFIPVSDLDPRKELLEELVFLPPLEWSGLEVLPKTLSDAIKLLDGDASIKAMLGQDIIECFLNVKNEMLDDYNKYVSDWEKQFVDSY